MNGIWEYLLNLVICFADVNGVPPVDFQQLPVVTKIFTAQICDGEAVLGLEALQESSPISQHTFSTLLFAEMYHRMGFSGVAPSPQKLMGTYDLVDWRLLIYYSFRVHFR